MIDEDEDLAAPSVGFEDKHGDHDRAYEGHMDDDCEPEHEEDHNHEHEDHDLETASQAGNLDQNFVEAAARALGAHWSGLHWWAGQHPTQVWA